MLGDEIGFVKSFMYIKKNKGPTTGLIQDPVVHQEKLVPMMNADHLAILAGVCFEESFATILKAYLLYQYIAFCRWALMPYSIKGFRYQEISLTSLGGLQSKDA